MLPKEQEREGINLDKRSKAVKGLKCCAEFLCGECPYAEHQHIEYKLQCVHKMHMDLAEILESKKTREEQLPHQDASEREHYCPTCNKFLGFHFNYRKKFCSECGQALIYTKEE